MLNDNYQPLILIVDDMPANIHVLAETLRADYRVKVATSGKVALDIVAKEGSRPDLILLDVMMSGMDGYEVCRRLKADPGTQEIPVIFVTARNNARDEEHGLNLGAVDYVTKPFQPAIVKARVQNHIKLKRSRQQNEMLANAIKFSSLAFGIAHPAGQMGYANGAFERLTGYGAGELRCQDWAQMLTPPEWQEVEQENLAALARTGEPVQYEKELFRKDGTRVPVEVLVHLARDADGKPQQRYSFLTDITDRIRQRQGLADAKAQADAARAQAERANSAKSHFLAAASHDLRQPLHALDIYVRLIAASVPPAGAGIVEKMQQCSDNLSVLLNDLLDLSKLDAGAIQPQPTVFSLAEVLADIATTHEPSAEQRDLLFRVAATRLVGHTDKQLLRQLLANLVGNAVRYTERGGVLVGVRRRDGKLWIEVWDTGIGIAADQRDEIFEPFRQLGNPARDQEHGSGLGLALVQRLAKVLGLQIRVSSRVGRGSMFAVEVPRASVLPVANDAKQRIMPARRRLRVALVEDQAFVREAMARGLAHLGHDVVAAADVVGLLAALEDVAPDVIVADYRLKGGSSGSEAIAVTRKCYGEHVSAVVVTGETDPDVVRSITACGLRVMHKPVQLDELQICLHELSAARQADAA